MRIFSAIGNILKAELEMKIFNSIHKVLNNNVKNVAGIMDHSTSLRELHKKA